MPAHPHMDTKDAHTHTVAEVEEQNLTIAGKWYNNALAILPPALRASLKVGLQQRRHR